MGIGPIPSTEKALRKAGLTIDDIGLFELNEAFAVQVLSFLDHFGIDDDDPRVNPWGGAIAVGHPLASSGVRLMIQLARQFDRAPRRALRHHRHVRRPRPGRHHDLGEPQLQQEGEEGVTDYSTIDFDSLVALAATTRSSRTRTCATSPLPSGRTLALITLDNGRDHTRPNTLGAATLLEYAQALDELKARARRR